MSRAVEISSKTTFVENTTNKTFALFRYSVSALLLFVVAETGTEENTQRSPNTSMLLQMIGFVSFLWPNNIPLCICTTSSLSIHLLMDT